MHDCIKLFVAGLLMTFVASAYGGDKNIDAQDSPPRLRPETTVDTHIERLSAMRSGEEGSVFGASEQPVAVFSPDAASFIITPPEGFRLALMDASTGKKVRTFGKINDKAVVAFTPDGKQLVSVDDGPSVRLWDLEKFKLIRDLDEGVGMIQAAALAVSPDGRTLALVSGSEQNNDKSISLWDLSSGDEIKKIPELEIPAVAVAFTPDSKKMLLLTSEALQIWEVVSGTMRQQIEVVPPHYIRKGVVKSNAGTALALSHDGKVAAIGDESGAIRMYRLVDGQELPPIAAHSRAIAALAFTPDGKLRSLGWDSNVCTWDVRENLKGWNPKNVELSAQAYEQLWSDLANEDVVSAYRAVTLLAANPKKAVQSCQDHLHPVPAADQAKLTQLATDLGSPDYNVRKRAARGLRKMGEVAIPLLDTNERRNQQPYQKILGELRELSISPEQYRQLATLKIIKRIGGEPDVLPLLNKLAEGEPKARFTEQVAALRDRLGKADQERLAETKLENLWEILAEEKAARPDQAIRLLASRSTESAVFLCDRLKPLARVESTEDDAKRIARLIKDLDNDDFVTREKATEQLTNLGKVTEPALRKALDDKPGPEVQQRLESIIKALGKPTATADELRVSRSLEALEQIGPEAVVPLEGLLKETRNLRLREQIAEVLGRLHAANSGVRGQRR